MTDQPQLSRQDLKAMTPQQILDAHSAGQLQHLITGAGGQRATESGDAGMHFGAGTEKPQQLDRDELADMAPTDIIAAHKRGRLDHITGGSY